MLIIIKKLVSKKRKIFICKYMMIFLKMILNIEKVEE